MDFQMKSSNHTFILLALLPIVKFIHKSKKICGVLKNHLIHECIDFIIKPLKKAAEFKVMMSDSLGVELPASYGSCNTLTTSPGSLVE